jgi:hypothetical protein
MSEVAGAVLVDSSHPEQRSRSLALLPPQVEGEAPALTALRKRYGDPDDMLPEGINFSQSLAQAGRAGEIGPVPLAVLTRAFPADDEQRNRVRPDLPGEVATTLEALWQSLQREMTGLSPFSTHVVAQRGGHYIHQDAPWLVVDMIRQVFEAVRGNRTGRESEAWKP